jgi:hypothetical protein
LSQYKGLPYHDSRYQGGPQKISGRVLLAYYDLGGEGVAYHDTDPQNHGSGELNPADGTYLNEFRIHEGVDTSYTKFQRKPDPIDDNPFNKVVPPAELVYVGWTEPGERFFRSLGSFSGFAPLAGCCVGASEISQAGWAASGKLHRFLQFRDCVLVHLFLEVCLTQLVMCKSKIRIHLDGLAGLAYRFVVGIRNEQKLRRVGFDDR